MVNPDQTPAWVLREADMASRGWDGVTLTDIARLQKQQQPAKPSKYRAQAVIINGHRFDSKKEGARYMELRVLQAAGHISQLELQPRFELWAADVTSGQPLVINAITVGEYVADFRYLDEHSAGVAMWCVEDVKSPATRTPLYKLKKKLAEACHGITITEV